MSTKQYTNISNAQIVRERESNAADAEQVVRVYDYEGEMVLCLPGYIQDSEVKLILRQLNSVFDKGYRCGDAARRHAIKKAMEGNDV